MTKCDFCFDNLEQRLPPACVAACPMRVLDYEDAETEKGMALWDTPLETHPFPLPIYSHTQPRLAIKPHAAMLTSQEKSVANLEEIRPRTPSAWDEVPLMLFTLLGQLAVGAFWVLWMMTDRLMPTLSLIPHLIIGASLGVGLLASFAHLGTKRNAWRVLAHLRRSWLSREILFAGLFGLGWLSTTLPSAIRQQVMFEAMAVTSIFGIGLVYSMGQVYRIPAAPGWNSWRTNASFMVSALLLGLSVMVPVLVYETETTGILLPAIQWRIMGSGILILLVAQLMLIRRQFSKSTLTHIRIGWILIGIILTIVVILHPSDIYWLGVPVFLIVALEEVLGRWLFYQSRT